MGEKGHDCFVPSACWRKIRSGILSTTRFSGILFLNKHRLAVYDIGDGSMEWQLRAERSLFYQNCGDFDTKATGILLICDDDKWEKVAENIIRVTMWHRKQLIGREVLSERSRRVKYVKAPIRIAWYYEHVYLTTPEMLGLSLKRIAMEEEHIKKERGSRPECLGNGEGDFEAWPQRFFINITSDLLKYVYFFAAIKNSIAYNLQNPRYAIITTKQDYPILRIYPELKTWKGWDLYVYGPKQNSENTGEKPNPK